MATFSPTMPSTARTSGSSRRATPCACSRSCSMPVVGRKEGWERGWTRLHYLPGQTASGISRAIGTIATRHARKPPKSLQLQCSDLACSAVIWLAVQGSSPLGARRARATIPQFQGAGAVPKRADTLGTPNTCTAALSRATASWKETGAPQHESGAPLNNSASMSCLLCITAAQGAAPRVAQLR